MSGAILLLPNVLSGLVRGIVSRDSVGGVKNHWSVGRILMGEARLLAPIETDPGAHPVYCTVGTGSKAAGAWR